MVCHVPVINLFLNTLCLTSNTNPLIRVVFNLLVKLLTKSFSSRKFHSHFWFAPLSTLQPIRTELFQTFSASFLFDRSVTAFCSIKDYVSEVALLRRKQVALLLASYLQNTSGARFWQISNLHVKHSMYTLLDLNRIETWSTLQTRPFKKYILFK